MRRRIFLFVAMLIGISTLLFLPLQVAIAASSKPDYPSCNSFGIQRFPERKEAPAFTLRGLNGESIALCDFRGKPVLITFWATWCSACKEDIVLLERFSLGKRDQLTILLIAIDGERERAVKKIIRKNKITLPVLLLLKEKVMDDYMVRGWVPQTFFIDQKGMLVGKTVGQRDWSSQEAWSCLKELFELH